jgi:23S rRNA-/tRNA-specific pseudouridylate synthase
LVVQPTAHHKRNAGTALLMANIARPLTEFAVKRLDSSAAGITIISHDDSLKC